MAGSGTKAPKFCGVGGQRERIPESDGAFTPFFIVVRCALDHPHRDSSGSCESFDSLENSHASI